MAEQVLRMCSTTALGCSGEPGNDSKVQMVQQQNLGYINSIVQSCPGYLPITQNLGQIHYTFSQYDEPKKTDRDSQSCLN